MAVGFSPLNRINHSRPFTAKTTQLFPYHSAHSKLTEFAGYEMPLWYTTTTEEHLAVRDRSGVFDVSHMGRFQVNGDAATAFLEGMVPTRVRQQPTGKAFYTLLLNDRGGIIDDLIILKLEQERYLLVVNAANSELDLGQLMSHAPPRGVEINDMTPSSAMIAVQGPEASAALQPLTELDLAQLKRFRVSATEVLGQPSLISRTGYTGEDGFEVIILGTSNEDPGPALETWEKLAGVSTPCGLGARDSLRLEAGFPLHGSDIDQQTDPFQADLSWVISADKGEYVGSRAVADLGARPPEVVRKGLVLDQGIPRHGFEILARSVKAGMVTSGTFSPILRKGIALCRVRSDESAVGSQVEVLVRDSKQPGRIARPPFYDERLYGWRRLSKGN